MQQKVKMTIIRMNDFFFKEKSSKMLRVYQNVCILAQKSVNCKKNEKYGRKRKNSCENVAEKINIPSWEIDIIRFCDIMIS